MKTTKSAIYAAVMMAILPFLVFAKGKKMSKPNWYPSPRDVYNVEEYLITEVPGSGKNADAAKIDAVNKLGSYVATKVKSELESSRTIQQTQVNGKMTQKDVMDISKNVSLDADVTLYALETTDAYYDKGTKTWYVCAFINRAKAFDMIRAEVDAARDKFTECYKKAEESTSSDIFAAIRQYNTALTAGMELLTKTSYASLFNE